LFERWLDWRRGEAKLVARIALVLFALIAGHTLLETDRVLASIAEHHARQTVVHQQSHGIAISDSPP